ncbi:hypothetical protein Taro_045042 [Colocasia esculenta]|uniref:PRONE domain-containing protein n=1 Tax=Colocasia esculenta TaxID=4460 RepID=A0A843WVJ5_COLES|nr:hypothetical protein [Colocasia esculenta]
MEISFPAVLAADQGLERASSTCVPLGGRSRSCRKTHLGSSVSRSFRIACLPDGLSVRKGGQRGTWERSPILWGCAVFSGIAGEGEEVEAGMGVLEEEEEEGNVTRDDDGSERKGGLGEAFSDSVDDDCRGSSLSSSEVTSSSCGERHSRHGSDESLLTGGWPTQSCSVSDGAAEEEKTQLDCDDVDKQKPKISEIEMMKERFSKLLLGEDMSGCGKGVCTALAISNAITNLCATLFGQLWRLEPLPPEKKTMWRREMEWLLCVSDHVVELIPSSQTFPDGSKLEVMTCRPRYDIFINLPALRKLDNMVLEILDSFSDTEFWYVDQGILASDSNASGSFRKPLQRQEEKWWLPVPRVPPGGLQETTRKQLQHKRECTNQILKAAMAINSNALAEMDVPESYLESLPKNGKIALGDVIHRYITSDQFSPECLLDCLDLSSEHQALEIANRVEASVFVWRRRMNPRPMTHMSRANSKWAMVRDLMGDAEKRELLAERAESLLICLKQRFPALTQTTLDMCKIQCNKDVGKSILESYSRVLESLAFNVIARIDDLLYVDDLTKHSDKFSSIPAVSVIAHKRVSIPYSVPVSSTPYATAYTTPSFSPAPLASPATRGDASPLISRKSHSRGFGVKRVLTNYLGVEVKGSNGIKNMISSETMSTTDQESLQLQA